MSKSIRCTLLTVLAVIAVATLLTFAACKTDHEHTVDETTWVSDKDWHYNPYSCEHSGGSNRAKHTFNDKFVCTVCGYSGVTFTLNADGQSYTLSSVAALPESFNGEFAIPSTYDNLPVTDVGESAFANSNVAKVTVPHSIVTVGKYAFQNCSALSSIVLPDGLKLLGFAAFENCSSLQSAVVCGEVVESFAFSGCAALKSITIGENVKYLSAMFDDCKNLETVIWNAVNCNGIEHVSGFGWSNKVSTVTFGENVEFVPHNLFLGQTKLKSVVFPDSVVKIGCMAFSNCENLENVTFGKNVKTIGWGAFQYTGISKLTLTENVTNIGFNAFYHCQNLESVQWNAIEVEDVSDGRGLFDNCPYLTELVVGNKVKYLPAYAFYNCGTLTSITFPQSLRAVGVHAFSSMANLKSVNVSSLEDWCKIDFADYANPMFYAEHLYLNGQILSGDVVLSEGVTQIPAHTFENSAISSITLPASLTYVGLFAFPWLNTLKSVYISNIEAWCNVKFEIYANPMYYAEHLYLNGRIISGGVVLHEGITQIPAYTFANSELTAITLPKSLTSIGRGAFENSNVKTVIVADLDAWCNIQFDYANANVPDSANPLCAWTTTYDKTFLLANFDVLGGDVELREGVRAIPAYTFYQSNVTSIKIPSSVERIEDRALSNCTSLETITYAANSKLSYIGNWAITSVAITEVFVPASVTHLGERAFGNSVNDIVKVTVEEGNTVYYDSGNCLIERSTGTVIFGCKTSEIPTDGSVKTIGRCAFLWCQGLTSISIPSSVLSIGYGAFSGCVNLQNVTFDANSNLEIIYQSAFAQCDSLRTITLPASLVTLDFGAFQSSRELETVIFEQNSKLRTIGDYAFYNCVNLKGIVIPPSIKNVGMDTFNGCGTVKMYFFGTAEQLNEVDSDVKMMLSPLDWYFYAETRPDVSVGKFWRFEGGIPTPWEY